MHFSRFIILFIINADGSSMLSGFFFFFFFGNGVHTVRLYILYKTWRILSGVFFHAAPFPRPQVTGSPDKASRAQPLLCKYLRSVAQVRVLMWICSGVRRGLRSSILDAHLVYARPRAWSCLRQVSARLPSCRIFFVEWTSFCLSIHRFSRWLGRLLRKTLFSRYSLWDYNGERKIRGIPSGLSIVACPRVIYRALDQASTSESTTGDWTSAHTAICSRFGIICSEIRVPVSGLVWNAPRTRAIKRRIKLHGDRPKYFEIAGRRRRTMHLHSRL